MTLNENISKPYEDEICKSVKYELHFQKFLQWSMMLVEMEKEELGLNNQHKILYLPSLFVLYVPWKDTTKYLFICLKHGKTRKPLKTNKQGPNEIWVPKDKLIPLVDVLSRAKMPIMDMDSGCSWYMMRETYIFQYMTLKVGGIVGFQGNQKRRIIGRRNRKLEENSRWTMKTWRNRKIGGTEHIWGNEQKTKDKTDNFRISQDSLESRTGWNTNHLI